MSLKITTERAVAGIDPHKHTATLAIVDARGGVRESASFPVTPQGITELVGLLTEAYSPKVSRHLSGVLT